MTKLINIVRAAAATACLAFSAWALYLRTEALPPYLLWIPGRPGVQTIAGIAIALALVILLAPLKAPGGREVTGAPGAKPNRATPILGMIAGTLVFAAALYLPHAAIWANERPIWVDHYAFVLLPVLLAATTALWLYDTVYGRIATGTATGKSPMKQRALLVLKRVGIAGIATAVMLQTLVPVFHITPSPAYRDATSQLMLTAILALVLSLAFTARRPTFTTHTDGAAGNLI